jgi:DNA polymerase IV
MPTTRAILHVDMDAFFASVVQLDRPELRGRAVLTGYDGPRGVVSAASYEARKFGCRSAMPMAQAKRLCPDAVVVKVPGERIRHFSAAVFDVFESVTPMVEPMSVDEAFLDVTGSARLLGDAVTIAKRIRRRIRDELGLTASVGVSFNKFLAKLASDMDKPDGLTVIGPGDVGRVLPGLAIERMWGVGPATAKRLKTQGMRTFGDLSALSEKELDRRFGRHGTRFHRLSCGLDDRPVTPDHAAKSIGQEQTFDRDVAERDHVRSVLLGQVQQVGRRLRKHGLRARGVAVKVRFGDFQTVTRCGTLDTASDLTDDLWAKASGLFDRWAAQGFSPVRLIGVSADRLEAGGGQLDLFADPKRLKRRRLDQAMDTIQERFGAGSVTRGSGGGS